MATELKFKLTRPARKQGGDRYEAEVGEVHPMVIYVPQKISRKEGVPAAELLIRIDLVN
jgi:hypothetical protein